MKFAHIGPNTLNKTLDKVNDIHLLLLHWAMENDEYYKFYRESKVYKILDNSFYELRKVLPINHILDLACMLKVQEVVAPDVMYDYKKTKSLVESFINGYKARYGEHKIFKIQAVACGKDEKEIWQCFNDYLNNPDIDIIAFARRGQLFKGECHDEARFRIVCKAVEEMKKLNIIKPIHLLGANGINDYYRDWPKEVRSIDSKQFVNAVLGNWKLNSKISWIKKQIFKNIINNLK